MKPLMNVAFLLLLILTVAASSRALGQDQPEPGPGPEHESPKIVKTGWTFGALPVVSFDSDEGFRYGALANFFYYGDGSTYPNYHHSLFGEWSKTNKGNVFNRLFYDSWHLLPATRTTVELAYITEQALNFYGFNGYEVSFNSWLEDPLHQDYVSRLYYRHDRKLLRLTVDFQQRLISDHFKWIAGAGFFNVQTGPIDVSRINKGKKEEDLVPDVPGIYQHYVEAGYIPLALKNGGNTMFLKAGIIHDTRDIEANPMKGTWNEAFFMAAPSFLGNGDYSYLQMVMIHRHYLTIVPQRLSMANRIGYQGKLTGDMPFYMLPFIFNSYRTYDGFGGAKTVRGMVRNRVQGDGIAYGNLEFRYMFLRTNIARQDVYLALSTFADGAMVVQKHPVQYHFPEQSPKKDQLHMALGAGFRVVLNQNFIVAVDYGKALKQQDGDNGLYIGLDFLY